MKNLPKITFPALICGIAISFLSSCQKSLQSPVKNTIAGTAAVNSPAFANYQAIALSSSAGDTIYAVNICHRGYQADTIAFSSLPDTIAKYLTANYSGYTIKKAFEIFNPSKTVQGYVVTFLFNGNPVALAFNAAGIFVNVIEQRQSQDLRGQGWHEGGCFDNRDGHHRDTIALTALPAVITTYFTTNYPKDTLKNALINRDSSYVVVSADTGIFVTEFTSTGTFIKRVQIYPHVVTKTTVTQAALPANIGTYLITTYPAYVFDAAFEVKLNGAAKGYGVFIDANSTKYLVEFDGGGNFVQSFTIR